MPGNFFTPNVTVFYTWPTPNYVDPEDRTWLLPYTIVITIISTVLSFGRFYLRARKQAGTFGFDDILIVVAWLFAVGMSTLAIIGSKNGLGRHTWDVPIDKYPFLVELGYFDQIFFLVSMCTTKLSVLLFYRRMVKDTHSRVWVYILWAAIFFNTSAGIAVLIVYLDICRPLNAYWLAYQYLPFHWDQPYTCIASGEGLTLTSCIISVITDVYAVAIPYFMLKQYRLDVPRRQKIALNVIFMLGWLATGCGIARTYYLWRMGHVSDLAWTGFDLLAWSLTECHIGIICACAPSLRAFFRQYVNISSVHRSAKRASRRQADGGEEAAGNPYRESTRSDNSMSDSGKPNLSWGSSRGPEGSSWGRSPSLPNEKSQHEMEVTALPQIGLKQSSSTRS